MPILNHLLPSFQHSRSFRFALLFALSLTELLPVSLLTHAMPSLLRRSGASMQNIGLLSLVSLPWALQALWAPLVDRLGRRSRFGRYRSWLFVTHPLLLLTLVLGSFVDIPALIISNRAVGIPALLWLSIVAATADTASHGLALNLLSPEERGIGNGVQNAGMMAGRLVGGGLMIILVGLLGWRVPLLIVAIFVMLPLIGIAFYREAPVDPAQPITFRAALAFLGRPRIGRWLAVFMLMSFLAMVPTVPFQSLFVDHGMKLTEIGLLLGVLSSFAGAAGGGVGGLAIKELGRQRAFYVLNGLFILCLGAAAWIVTRPEPGRPLLYLSIGFVFFGLSASGTIACVMMMDRSRGHLASSDYTIQASAGSLLSSVGSVAGGFFAERWGAAILFIIVPLLLLAVTLVCVRVLDRRDFAFE